MAQPRSSGGSGSGSGGSRRRSSSGRSSSSSSSSSRSGASRSSGSRSSSGSSGSRSSSGSSGSRSSGSRSSGSRSSGSRSSGSRSRSSAGTSSASSGAPDARFDAAAQRLRKLNERIIAASKDAGETTLTSYERVLKTIASSLERGPGSSDVEWIANLATTQAKFIRDVTSAWTSAARNVLK